MGVRERSPVRVIAALAIVLLVSACNSSRHPSAPASTTGTHTAATGAGTLVYLVNHGSSPAVGEMNPDGTGAHLLPIGGAICCYAPDLSPDGTQLVVAGEGTVAVSASDGTGQRVIWSSATDMVTSPVWSPDGKLIAFGATSTAAGPGPARSQLYVVAPDGTGLRGVTPVTNIRDIAWSPDGTSLAFLQNQAQIWTVPLAGGTPTSLYGPAQGEPPTALEAGLSWAPAGAVIFDEEPPYGVWSYQPGQPKAKFLLANATGASWSPDGTRFAAVLNGRVVIGSAGGHPTTVGPIDVQSVRWGATAQLTQLAAGPLHAVGADVTAATLIPVNETTASVTDSDHTSNANQLAATINWGDGSAPSPGTVNVDNDSARCPCGVSGTHTYQNEGDYTVTTTITKTARSGQVVETVHVLSTGHVAWALLHAVQADKIVRNVSWPGAQAVLTWAAATGSPPGAAATIDWGDGSAATTIGVPSPSLVTAFTGLARGYDDVGLATGHTYGTAGSFHLVVTVNAPGHPSFSSDDFVAVEPSTPSFTVSPSTPHAGIPGSPAQPAMLEPDPQSPTGAPVTEWDWNFGDGTTFVDTPAREAAWSLLLHRPGSHSDLAFVNAALSVGIDVTLGGHVDPAFGWLMWAGLPAHIVPHVFSIPQGYQISLTEKTSLGSATGTQNIATQTSCNLWADGLFGNYTVCDTARGWQAATASPTRWPDYYTFLLSLGGNEAGIVGSASVGLTLTSSGDVYISYGASGGLGVSLPGGTPGQVGFGMGFVEAPDGPKPDPGVINNYVDGWTVNAGYSVTLGPFGGSEAIVWSPSAGLGGVEYYLTVQNSASLSLTTGGGCAMHIGNVSQPDLTELASLVPGPNGPWPWQPGIKPPVVNTNLIGQILSLVPSEQELRTCGVLAPGAPS